ncbi:MAG TPA: cyclic nucleotide-binding domain-containing protein [Devosia sp.]|nr:cyclic nucleotide-binding domain-containing protein [Devosia sp.]
MAAPTLAELAWSQPLRTLEAGDVLITEGSPGGMLYVLESGRLVVERDGVALATLTEPGALIGEMSVLLGTDNSADVRAIGPSKVREIRDGMAFLQSQPAALLQVATGLATRLDNTSAIVVRLQSEHRDRPEQHSIFTRLAASLLYGGPGDPNAP